MNEAEIAKIVAQQIEAHGQGNYWLGFIALGALYIIKELWKQLQEKNKDPNRTEQRELTRIAIAHIEARQTEIIEDIKDIRETMREIERKINHLETK